MNVGAQGGKSTLRFLKKWRIAFLRKRAASLQAGKAFHSAVRLWISAVRLGDGASAYHVGEAYRRGEGVIRSLAQAARWYERAVALDHPLARVRLAELLLTGAPDSEAVSAPSPHQRAVNSFFDEGVKPDVERAKVLLTQSAEDGDLVACTALGVLYFEGRHTPVDYVAARAWFLRTPDDPTAQFALGDILFRGLDVDADHDQAADWYEKAAKQGHPRGQLAFGSILRQGRARPLDLDAARAWICRAADQGDPIAQTQAARMCLAGEGGPVDVNKAETFLRAAARRDFLPAILQLAELLSQGGFVEPDLLAAAHFYDRAADMGDVNAQFIAGRFAADGVGRPQNLREAARRFLSAAEQGHIVAAHNFAALLARGVLGKPEPAAIIQWYEVAAKAGLQAAEAPLAELLLEASTPLCDVTRGLALLEKAAERGEARAQTRLALHWLQHEADRWEDADRLLRAAASSGDAKAAFELGRWLAHEQVRPTRTDEAREWLARAADAGHVGAQYLSATMALHQATQSQEVERAIELLRAAASSRSAAAAFHLGVLYCQGQKVAQDLAVGAAWYAQAAELGHAVAQHNLGVMLINGLGVEKDRQKGEDFIRRSGLNTRRASDS